MSTITIHASRLRSFGDSRESAFSLITSPELTDRFRIEPGEKYARARVVGYAGDVGFGTLLAQQVPENAHVLVILPNVYFKSPSPDDLGRTRKLAVMACSSTPTSLEAIAHFIRMGERTDPEQQERKREDFFARGQATESIRFVDDEYGTSAVFEHLDDDLFWHEQIGRLGWGDQQLFPSGEISVLPVQVFGQNIDSRLRVTGRLALRAHPVLHSGTPSFLPEDQERIFRALVTAREAPVIATLERGVIVGLEPAEPRCAPAAHVFGAMCEVDSRYRTLLEIGFGVNTGLELFPGNSAMNEVYGGVNGVVHFGLGLIPYTQYHLDLLCPHTSVLTAGGALLFGGDPAA